MGAEKIGNACNPILSSTLSHLKGQLDNLLGQHNTIVLVYPYDTGIQFYIKNIYKNRIEIKDYLKFIINPTVQEKTIIMLTPYEYKYLKARSQSLEEEYKAQLKIIKNPL